MPRSPLKTWLRFDPMVGLLTIPIAIFLIIVELDTPKANIPQTVGPEVMPIGVLMLLIVNAVFLFLQSTSGKRAAISSASVESPAPPSQPWLKKYRGIILVLLGLTIYGFILAPLGFILATSFLIIYEARILQPGKWVRNVVLGVGSAAVVYFTFVKFLNVMLPAGILG